MNVRLLSLGFAALFSMPAAAQDGQTPLSPLFECRQLTDNAARLACLDAAVEALYESENTGELVAVERSEIEAAEEATYGLNIPEFRLPRLPNVSMPRFPSSSGSASSDLAEAADASNAAEAGAATGAQSATSRVVQRNEAGEITSIEGLPVQNIDRDAYDRMVITLQNGQTWRQIDDTRVLYSSRQAYTDMIVHVRSAALGSHQMQLNDRGRWFRVRRVD